MNEEKKYDMKMGILGFVAVAVMALSFYLFGWVIFDGSTGAI